MGTEYIASTVNNLFEKLDIASKNLDGFLKKSMNVEMRLIKFYCLFL